MSLLPLEEFPTFSKYPIKLIATDMDGTLTLKGKFTVSLLQALETLAQHSFDVIIVTGRSAGWVQSIKNYLPIKGAISENGGIYFPENQDTPEILTAIEDITEHRQKLAQMFHTLKNQFPQLKESADNQFRLTDWTFDVQGLSIADLEKLEKLCFEEGWGFTYSTVQCHIKPMQQDKASSLNQVLHQYFHSLTRDQIITVGDSPNDESLFNQNLFPLSVGVANILHYKEQLQHLPVYVTQGAEIEGFYQLTEILINKK
jgi:HAD superfamily hydrolase (TIGR01484 family)